jgi:hypothetical protein
MSSCDDVAEKSGCDEDFKESSNHSKHLKFKLVCRDLDLIDDLPDGDLDV